jgi:hypothetical protein
VVQLQDAGSFPFDHLNLSHEETPKLVSVCETYSKNIQIAKFKEHTFLDPVPRYKNDSVHLAGIITVIDNVHNTQIYCNEV